MQPTRLPAVRIERAIVRLRGQNVMLDADLALLYGVTTKALNQAVRRNQGRFPRDFMFRLIAAEARFLRSQTVTLNNGREAQNLRSQTVTSRSHGGRRNPPWAFTEQGVAMLSSVLRSHRAIAVNIEIMRAFVQMRLVLASMPEFTRRLDGLERKYDGQFRIVFNAIRALMQPSPRSKRVIGFRPKG